LKTIVNALAVSVRRAPWAIIAGTIIVTLVLGGYLGGQFLPEEDSNSSFTPDAPELVASTIISETFGAVTRMQVLTSSNTGDVITLDAFVASGSLDESVRASESAEFIVDSGDAPGVLSYLAPVYFALEEGATTPTSDADVKNLYLEGLEQVPPQFRSFLKALLSEDADFNTATAEFGLTAITYVTSDDFDERARRAVTFAEAVWAADAPASITLEPFSQDLIFGSSDEFLEEIARLFVSAALIIVLVLSTIFLVKPGSNRDRGMFYAGMALMIIGASVSIGPSLALLFPDVFPTAWTEVAFGTVVLTAAALYAVAFIMWTAGSRRLRRTTADTLITMVAIVMAIQWMNGYGFLRFTDQSQLATILPILLIGLGVDYSIHMTVRYRQELSGGKSVDAAISAAIRTAGIALVLATVTTAVGFLTNVTNEIPALREFGELAAIGIGFSFLLMLTFVPAVRELLDRRAEKSGRLDTAGLETGDSRLLPRLIGRTAVLPKRFAVATIIVAVVLTAMGAYGRSQLSTEFSFLDFVPTTSPLRDTAITVDENFEFPETTSVLVKGDVATGEAWNTMLASFVAAGSVPDVQTIEAEDGAIPLGTTFTGLMFTWLNPESPAFDEQLKSAAVAAGIGEDNTFAGDADLNLFYDVAVANHPLAAAAVLGSDGSNYTATLYNFDTVAGEKRPSELGDNLNEAFELTAAAGLAAVTTSSFIISDLITTSLRDTQQTSLALTLGAVFLLLVVNYWYESKRPMLGVITTVPVVMVVLWSFGIMAALGIPLGPVTSLISAIGIGIGIPYMIHVTQRYLEERVVRSDENEAIQETLTHTGGALGGSALTTAFGFGILMVSTTIPFQQFGFVLAYTIVLALLAAVLVLPSMLVLWDRWHRNRGDKTLDADFVSAAMSLDD
jgi:predicted RND superfamily exporter protein